MPVPRTLRSAAVGATAGAGATLLGSLVGLPGIAVTPWSLVTGCALVLTAGTILGSLLAGVSALSRRFGALGLFPLACACFGLPWLYPEWQVGGSCGPWTRAWLWNPPREARWTV